VGAHPAIGVSGGPTHWDRAYTPCLSGAARLVAFELSAGAHDPASLWLYDRGTGHSQIVARGTAGATYEPRLSADGSALVFTVGEDGIRGRAEVYRRSLTDGTITLVSRANGRLGAPADGDAGEPAVSNDGTLVAFSAHAGNLGASSGPTRIYVRDVVHGRTEVVSPRAAAFAFDPAISGDGRFVAFAARPHQRDGTPDPRRASLYVHDRLTGRTVLASRTATDHRAGGVSAEPALSDDGRYVAFTSDAQGLDPRKPAGIAGVFVRDLKTGRSELLSRHPLRDPAGRTAHASTLCRL
jgi:Tol biopolymer transport system component